MWAVNKHIPVYSIATMEARLVESVSKRRFNIVLVAGFAVLALLLAAIGIYGVIAYMVDQRAHEIGVRIALGAHRLDIFTLVVGQGLRLTLYGEIIGLAGALALTRLNSYLLFGISALDLWAYAAVIVIVTSVALLACALPVRRALEVDPIAVLRYD